MTTPTVTVYADQDDLEAWLPNTTQPPSTDRLLRSASLLVARACNRNPYGDTPDPVSAAGLRDATCAQVAAWITLGVDPAMQGTDVAGPVKSSSILDATVARDTTAANKAIADAVDGLCDEATAILLQTGLLYVATPQFDSSGCLPTWGLDVPWWDGIGEYPPLAETAWPFQ